MSLLTSFLPAQQRASVPSTARAGAVIRPHYQLQDQPEAWALTVHLPGVSKEGLEITAEDGQLRITGRPGWQRPAEWTPVHRETSDAAYELALSHDHMIDADKITAELREGVLRVSLPKPEARRPRRIAVA